jgi:hypothetical protein
MCEPRGAMESVDDDPVAASRAAHEDELSLRRWWRVEEERPNKVDVSGHVDEENGVSIRVVPLDVCPVDPEVARDKQRKRKKFTEQDLVRFRNLAAKRATVTRQCPNA